MTISRAAVIIIISIIIAVAVIFLLMVWFWLLSELFVWHVSLEWLLVMRMLVMAVAMVVVIMGGGCTVGITRIVPVGST